MSQYIDGFVFPIPQHKVADYKRIAQQVAEIWKEHGALAYHEFVGDDLHLSGTRSFVELTDAKEKEAVIFGWVTFDSLAARNQANKGVAADPRMTELIAPLTDTSRLIFNAERMFYGGFKALLSSD